LNAASGLASEWGCRFFFYRCKTHSSERFLRK
jgi:hypothetical protein